MLRIVFLQLVCLIGLRDESVGADTYSYVIRFNQSITQPMEVDQEIGFVLVREIFSFFIPSAQLYLLFITATICYSFYVWILKHSPDKLLSAYVFCTFGLLSYAICLLRQFIALGIIIHGVEAVKERKLIKVVFFTFFAMLFHRTAATFVLIYPIAYWGLKREALLLVLGKYFSSTIGIATVIAILTAVEFGRYNAYIGGSGTSSAFLMILAYIGVLVAALFFKKNIIKNDKKNIVYFNCLVLAIVILMLGEIVLGITRIAMYFSVTLMLFVPEIVTAIPNRNLRSLGYVLVIVFGAFQLVFTALYGHLWLIPYSFFWQ